jgi:hypothetical protein
VAVLVVPGVALVASGAWAIDCEPTPAEREDLEFLAEQEGIDLDEAIERYGWHPCFSEIASSLEEGHPDDFAGAAIVQEDLPWIPFRDEVPADARELTEEVPATVELIGDRGFSEGELDETLRTVHEQVAAHPDVAASSGGYDVDTGHITILAEPVDEIDGEGWERLESELQPDPPDNEAVTVEVHVVEDIDAATARCHVLFYIYLEDESGRRVGEALCPLRIVALQMGREPTHVHGRALVFKKIIRQLLAVDSHIHGLPDTTVGPGHIRFELGVPRHVELAAEVDRQPHAIAHPRPAAASPASSEVTR